MIAAIYARKSTDQTGVEDDQKSVARQIDNARAFAASKGWTIADAHIYADEAISGAETRKLVQRQRLLDLIASGRAPFQMLIVRDASRFSRRDGVEAVAELRCIAQAGVAVWFYGDGSHFKFGNFGDNVIGFVQSEMAAEYRRQITRWTTEAMHRKAKAGHCVGGRVFGYDNIRVDGHSERRINEAEAAVVRQIFERCASGWGYTRIAKHLNAERALAPRAQQKRPSGWSPSTIYEVLHRPLYMGRVVWNKTRKRDVEGKTAPTKRPEAEWLHVDRPELRIVSDKAWQAVHTRLRRIRARLSAAGSGGNHRRPHDIDSKYLLSGFARCATCGGTLSVLSRSSGDKRIYAYGCLAHAKRGATVCPNALVLPIARVDDAVLAKLKREVRPAVIRALLDEVFQAMQPRTVGANIGALRAELRALDAKIANLTAAVESGAALAPLVAKLHERQAEREALMATIASAEMLDHLQADRATIERKALERVERWREMLDTNARQVLRDVLDGPMQFTPNGKTYHFDGGLTTGDFIAGLVGIPPNLASPTGFEPVFWP